MMTEYTNTIKNSTKRIMRRGFTLIEILIVVVILGVLAALVIPGVVGALGDANTSAASARAAQITTMVTRLNQFKPDGASITLNDAQSYSAGDLAPLVTAKYCTADDLANQINASNGWTWNAATSKFTPTP
jgi:prepilin-type N-terminal cleavage/methylation domain-containing protein